MMPRQRCPFCQNHPRLEVERELRRAVGEQRLKVAHLQSLVSLLCDALEPASDFVEGEQHPNKVAALVKAARAALEPSANTRGRGRERC